MKYAIEFDVVRHENGKLSYVMGNQQIVCTFWMMYEQFDFECDYWDWFKEEYNTPELKYVTDIDKEYHVFQYGSVVWDESYSWEYGTIEIDGLIFEPEYTSIEKKK